MKTKEIISSLEGEIKKVNSELKSLPFAGNMSVDEVTDYANELVKTKKNLSKTLESAMSLYRVEIIFKYVFYLSAVGLASLFVKIVLDVIGGYHG